MLPASMLLDLKHPTYAYVLVMDLACDKIYGTLLNNIGQPIFLKLRPEITIYSRSEGRGKGRVRDAQ